jgi:hypothetical protein
MLTQMMSAFFGSVAAARYQRVAFESYICRKNGRPNLKPLIVMTIEMY